MDVEIINFPETKVAVIEHQGSPESEHESVKKLVAWRIKNKLPLSDAHRSYGIHYNDPRKVPASDYRVDFCISIEKEVTKNSFGVLNKCIPALRCAKVRHFGSRENISAAHYLYEEWLPSSGEKISEFPLFFHYVNIGPEVQESAMITDIYLPVL